MIQVLYGIISIMQVILLGNTGLSKLEKDGWSGISNGCFKTCIQGIHKENRVTREQCCIHNSDYRIQTIPVSDATFINAELISEIIIK